ncbi:hypothetical protein AVEN_203340-1 [Araneus ventricosus]|uniref:Uncharacterized protein n=1 Tax=Araneus ventricosus TaxID=182803 RepID=A0A4Y2R6R8_ARAVE|nr:hypothetical protein AVEN_203340-1 [Araneus ventricosus]
METKELEAIPKNPCEDSKSEECDKYQRLIQSTIPGFSPREISESIAVTAENFKKTMDCLKERFTKESVLIQVRIREPIAVRHLKNQGQ